MVPRSPVAGWLVALLLLGLAGPGCRRSSQPKQASPDAPPPAPAPPAYEPCTRARQGGAPAPKALRWGKLQLQLHDQVLEPSSQSAAPARLVLGALADTKEALPATLEQVQRLLEELRRRGASMVVVLGGLDTSFEGARAVLQAAGGLPLVGLPGDRESLSGWQAAMDALPGPAADLTKARALVLPGVSLVGVPGYHLPHHLMAKEQGCSYDRDDLRALAALARRLPQPRLLLAHGPPRGRGQNAIDRAFGEVNIGDPLLGELLREADIRFGLFAHVHESAGRATTRDGRPVAEGEWSEELLLNVGSADSVPHEDLSGRWSRGSAALLELAGGRARYYRVNLSQLERSHLKAPDR